MRAWRLPQLGCLPYTCSLEGGANVEWNKPS